ncbi:hypothetical protein JCM5296_005227 [Sporobolomyces johnsonii]
MTCVFASTSTDAGGLFQQDFQSTSAVFRGSVKAVDSCRQPILDGNDNAIKIPIYKAPVLVFMALHLFLSQKPPKAETELLNMTQHQIARSFQKHADSIRFDLLEDIKVVLDLEEGETNKQRRSDLGFGSDYFGWFWYKAKDELYRRLGDGLANLLKVDADNKGLICIAWARWYCTRYELRRDDPNVSWPLVQERRTALENLYKKHQKAVGYDVNSTPRRHVPSDSDSDSDDDDDVPHHPHRAETFPQARESRRSDTTSRPRAPRRRVPSDSDDDVPHQPSRAETFPQARESHRSSTAYYTSPLANPSAPHPHPAYAEGSSSAGSASYVSPTSSRRHRRRRASSSTWQGDIPTRHRSDR